MKDALLIELAQTWELQASTGGDGLNMLQPATRETLRQCADVLRMLVDAQSAAPSPAPAVQPTEQRSPNESSAMGGLRNGCGGGRLCAGPAEPGQSTASQTAEEVAELVRVMELLLDAPASGVVDHTEIERRARTLIAKHGQPQGDSNV